MPSVDNHPVSVEHYENFPVASWLCPAALRPAVVAIYHYARTADDLADEGDATAARRLADLAAYRCDLEATLSAGLPSSRWPRVFTALGAAIVAHRLPVAPLTDLLSAFEQDVVQHRYAGRAELLDYCRRSANPVGRLVLHLHGIEGPEALRRADAICTGLQLINFWQDLSVDLARGRRYVPLDDAAQHGVDLESGASGGADTAAAAALIRALVGWARGFLLEGAPLVHALPGRAGWELRLVVQGGLAICDRVERLGAAAFTIRPTLGPRDAASIAWRALTMRTPLRSTHPSAGDAGTPA